MRQCPWPSGLHNFEGAYCTRCGEAAPTSERVDVSRSADSGRWSVAVSGFASVAEGREAARAALAAVGARALGEGWAVRESASYPACMVYGEAR